MSDDSKNQLKWLKAKFFEIVEGYKKKNPGKNLKNSDIERAVNAFKQELEGGRIPPQLTIPKTPEDPDSELISIHFRRKCLDHEQIELIDKEDANLLVRKLRQVNTTTKPAAQTSGLIRDKVENKTPYDFLFNDLSPETEVLEIQYAGDGRIFGFFIEATFNVICIRTQHINLH